MKKFVLLAGLALLCPHPLIAYQKGIALGLYSKDPGYSYQTDLEEIRRVGADHVSLIVSWYQKNIQADDIYPRWEATGDFETVSDRKLAEVIRQAHQTGLKVFLFPILRIEERKEKEWRGVVVPKDLPHWLQSYRQFTLHYARLAAKQRVELFSIGSELCSMEKEVPYWKGLISEVRGLYRGELLYSANWDHYKKIEFWDDLDYLGLNGYYELSAKPAPSIRELTQKWWDIQNEIANWQEQRRKKILFTEIGYPSIDGGCGKPWDYTREAPVNLEEQALCYEAFFLTWERSQKFGGVYFWNWYGQGGGNDRSYTPRGKPAEKVLTKWFRNTLPSSSRQSSFSSPVVGPPRKDSSLPASPLPSS